MPLGGSGGGGGGTSQVLKTNTALGAAHAAYESAFTWVAVAAVCKRGTVSRFTIDTDNNSAALFDLEVRRAGAATELFLQATGVDGQYDVSVPWYYESNDGSMYIGIKNRGGARTFTLTTLRLEKFA